MNKVTMWILVVAALVIGFVGGFFIANNQASKSMMMVKEDMEKQLDAAKMENEKMMNEDKMMKDNTDSSTQDDSMMQDDKMIEK